MSNTPNVPSADQTTVTLNGDLTIKKANGIKKEILSALKKSARVVVDITNMSAGDLSLLQIICSAHRTADIMNKQFSILGGDKKTYQQLIWQSGYLRHIGCRESLRKSCLWMYTGESS